MNSYQDKVVLITGATRGIGKAIAYAFAAQGASIAINYRNNDALAKVLEFELPGAGHASFQADVGNANAAKELVDRVVDHFGKIDILVNNAGIHKHHPVDQVDFTEWQKEWEETLAVNLLGPAHTMYAAAQHMIKQGGGKMISVSSRGAFRGEPDQPAYGASKAGLNALSQSLAQKLAPYGITVGVVAPCFTQTDMVKDLLDSPAGEVIKKQSPIGRVATPEDVANAVLFFAHPDSHYCTGAILDVNGASYLRS